MDFWAQHKDFILKVLAGLGVFLVALIARGIVHGDDLERAESLNKNTSAALRRKKLVPRNVVASMTRAADSLQNNVESIASEIGYDASDEKALQRTLLERILGRIVTLREIEEDPKDLARQVEEALAVNLNGAFGALRLRLRDEMMDEASERNVAVPEDGFGAQNLVSIEQGDLTKYLLQLELVSRVLTDALGMKTRGPDGKTREVRFKAIDEVRIDTEEVTAPPIPGANPKYLREYRVRFQLVGNEAAVTELVNRLETGSPRVPVQMMSARRRDRDMIEFEIHLLAVAINPKEKFAAPEEQG